jgi:SAM-dependent methyltransferase
MPVPAAGWDSPTAQEPPDRAPETRPQAPFLPTPEDIVEGMLELARVGEGDVVYDLGCGDGRIVIAAVKDYGADRGVCVEIDRVILDQARQNARFEGVEDRIEMVEADLFDIDLSPATVVALYLLPQMNLELRPKLWRELRPGTRVVSHRFHMGNWEPQEEVRFYGRSVYLWTIGEGDLPVEEDDSPTP